MFGEVKAPPTPTEEQALDFIVEALRAGTNIGRNNYEVYLDVVAEQFVRMYTTVPPGQGVEVKNVMGPFYSGAWALCRLGVLRPGPTPGRSHLFTQNHEEAQGYGITEFGRRWIAETQPILPTLPGKMTDMLLNTGRDFGDAYKLRSQDAVLAYNGHAYFACCAMVGAAAEAILLAATGHKLGEEQATRIYTGSRGRSRLKTKL